MIISGLSSQGPTSGLFGVRSQRERSVLQSTKLKRIGNLKNILIPDMELQSLELAQLVFSLAFGPVFPCYFIFPKFCKGYVYPVTLCIGSMWSSCCFVAFLLLYSKGDQSHLITGISDKILKFRLLSKFETVLDNGDFWSWPECIFALWNNYTSLRARKFERK